MGAFGSPLTKVANFTYSYIIVMLYKILCHCYIIIISSHVIFMFCMLMLCKSMLSYVNIMLLYVIVMLLYFLAMLFHVNFMSSYVIAMSSYDMFMSLCHGPGSNGNEKVLRIPPKRSITRVSPLDCLESYIPVTHCGRTLTPLQRSSRCILQPQPTWQIIVYWYYIIMLLY